MNTEACRWCRIQLGDTPDTSKALRSLVAAGLVARSGRGGRHDAFRYQVCRQHTRRRSVTALRVVLLSTVIL